MLDSSTLTHLRASKNLLAFSAGSDSTALFHLLLDAGIVFDIAHVNYQTRAQCAEEEAYATALAAQHNTKCHTLHVTLKDENFEHEARLERYAFFEQCIKEHGYNALLTAHHLGDRLEWFLMQLCKGAGLNELLGMQPFEIREAYTLIRPLLHVSKPELTAYLESRRIAWYEDSSNSDTSIKRNYFRHHFSQPLLQTYARGIQKSFEYLNEERTDPALHVKHFKALTLFKSQQRRIDTLRIVDRILKTHGYLMRQGDKAILKSEDAHVVGRRYVVALTPHYGFIAPYRNSVMTRTFKEECRKLKIPKLLRGYLYEEPEVFEALRSLLSTL